jgi:hypothetical protein
MQRAHPSYNPRGTCPRWAKSPAAPGGPMRHTQQFLSTWDCGGGQSVCCAHAIALDAALANFTSVFSPSSPVFSPPRFSTHFEVVQRARPAYNPKGTCPRWAKSLAAPSGPMRHTQQFLSTSEGGERDIYIEVGKVFSPVRSRTSCRTRRCISGFVHFFFLAS